MVCCAINAVRVLPGRQFKAVRVLGGKCTRTGAQISSTEIFVAMNLRAEPLFRASHFKAALLAGNGYIAGLIMRG